MRKILMIDDSQIACTLIRLELMPFGYQVVFADSIEDAMAKLEADPDLSMVVLDFSVAEVLGGSEVLHRLRAQRPSRHLPVILHSAIHEQELSKQAEFLGADGAYRKGGRLLDLVGKIGQLCATEPPSRYG